MSSLDVRVFSVYTMASSEGRRERSGSGSGSRGYADDGEGGSSETHANGYMQASPRRWKCSGRARRRASRSRHSIATVHYSRCKQENLHGDDATGIESDDTEVKE